MFRHAAPVYHRCPECTHGYRRRDLASHMALVHPSQPLTWWARFTAWIRALISR